MKRWRGLKSLVQDTVDKGSTAIEQVHLSTAARPFAWLRKGPPLQVPVQTVQAVHDVAVAASYGMVRHVNRAAGKAVDLVLDVLER